MLTIAPERLHSMLSKPAVQRALREAAIGLGILAIYVLLSSISALHQYKGLLIRPWNPSVGFMFAVIILFGYRHGFLLFLSSVATGIIVRGGALGPVGILGAAAIIAMTYTTAAWVTRRYLHLDVELKRLRDVLTLLVVGVVATVPLTILLTALLLTLGRLEQNDLIPALLRLFVGNAIGIAVVAPLVMRLVAHWRAGTLGEMRGVVTELLLYAAVSVAIFAAITLFAARDEFRYFYLLFFPVITASVRHGLDGACITLAAAQLGLVMLLRAHGYGASAFTEFQILLLVLTATALVVGVVISEREEIARTAHAAQELLKQREAEAAQTARFSLVSGMASSLAHEMSQPMTAARALARSVQHLVRETPPDLPRIENNVSTLIAQVDHASGIVRRARDFLSRKEPRMSTLFPAALVEEAIVLINAELEARRIALTADVSKLAPPIQGDRVQLQQVLLNLIRNSIDALEGCAQPRIAISVVRKADDLVFSVMDNGAGIDESMMDKLFQPLTTSKTDGLGLGLSISEAIIEAHGGRLWIASSMRGTTEFRFSLPLNAR